MAGKFPGGANPLDQPLFRNLYNAVKTVEMTANQISSGTAGWNTGSRRLNGSYQSKPSAPAPTEENTPAEGASAYHNMTPEDMTPEEMTPMDMTPSCEVPLGISTEGPPLKPFNSVPLPSAEYASPAQFLSQLGVCGLRGAILSTEILGKPVALRRRWGR